MEQVNFIKVPIVRAAEKWRDLDKKTIRNERIAKIACLAGVLIVLAAVVVSSYYLARATDSGINYAGDTYTYSLAPAMTAPIVLGAGFTTCLGLLAFYINFEGKVTTRTQNEIVDQLMTKTWKELCELYRNESFQQLVRGRYITVEEGNQFKVWRTEYEELKKVIDVYENEPLIQAKIDQHIFPKEYAEARVKLHELEKAWRIQQNMIRGRAQLAPLGGVGNAPVYKEMDQFTLLQSTKADKKWRDLSKEQIRNVRIARITTVALWVVLLLAIALGCYFLATTSSTYGYEMGEPLVVSNAVFCMFPAAFGLGMGMMLSAMSDWARHDMNYNNYYGRKRGLCRKEIQLARFLLLAEGALPDIYDHYFQKNGGLTLLVQKGFLTVDQAKVLRELHLKYHDYLENMKPYADVDDGDSGKQQLNNQLDTLERGLKELQKLIKQSLTDKKELEEKRVIEKKEEEQKGLVHLLRVNIRSLTC